MRPPETPPGRKVGLALSGGGWRAAAFHLGGLKRLEELGVLQQVRALSCVSGGSVTGALYALRCTTGGAGQPGAYPVDDLIDEMRPILCANLRARAFFGSPVRALRTLASFLMLGGSRARLIADELDRQLYSGSTLSQLPDWIVLNATNLRTGKAWKFYADVSGDYLVGATLETASLRVAEAVAASAAFPGLTEPFRLKTRWESLTGVNMSGDRWRRPKPIRPDFVSTWRDRYGHAEGRVAFPLSDGGLYDNDGLNGLRGWQVSHAVFSGASPAEVDSTSRAPWVEAMRMINVMHDRLGGSTRQLAYEMAHGAHPGEVAAEATAVSQALLDLSHDSRVPEPIRDELETLALRVASVRRVDTPRKDHQFQGLAQVLLHRTDLARDQLLPFDEKPFPVPAECRGLPVRVVDALARVRTDLDALDPLVFDLLLTQGYFLCDALVKQSLQDLLPKVNSPQELYEGSFVPQWTHAVATVKAAAANENGTVAVVSRAWKRGGIVGRVPDGPERAWNWAMATTAALVAVFCLVSISIIVARIVHALLAQ